MEESSELTEEMISMILGENGVSEVADDESGWKTVEYKKKRKNNGKQKKDLPEIELPVNDSGNVFLAVEQHSAQRRQRLIEVSNLVEGENSVVSNGNGESHVAGDAAAENGVCDVVKTSKPKKPKVPKVSVQEAAAKINETDLVAFLIEINESYDTQPDIQMMRFADYFGRAFSTVSSSQFPWMKLLRESSVVKMADIPLANFPEDVYKISVDWLNQRSSEALSSFVIWLLDNLMTDLGCYQGTAKGSKKEVPQTPSKSQAAIFFVLAMLLRSKPDVLISLFPEIKGNRKYEGQDKLPLMVWIITQACQGDIVVGLFMWVHFLLPMLGYKANANPQSKDLILQVVERIIISSKARVILVNGAVKKGKRVVPPSALEFLMEMTFPAPIARLKATERFEAIYPILKEVAIAAAPGSKAMKQITREILPIALEAAGNGIADLSSEASELFIWCLDQNLDCYKQWDDIYLENLEESMVVLEKISDGWKTSSIKHSNLDPLNNCLRDFMAKNEKSMACGDSRQALLNGANMYCKKMLRKTSRGNTCMRSFLLVTIAASAGAAFILKVLQ